MILQAISIIILVLKGVHMIKRNRTNVYKVLYYLAFTTKYRKEIFDSSDKQNEIKELLSHYCNTHNIRVDDLEVMPDHIHMVISFEPKYSISTIVKMIKGSSARLWFKKHPEDKSKLYRGHLWTNSYYIETVGDVSKEIVLNYDT